MDLEGVIGRHKAIDKGIHLGVVWIDPGSR